MDLCGQLFYQLKATHSTQVLVNRWFIKKRGRALGILSTSSPLGQLLLSPVTQLLIISWSWRPTLFFWAGMVAVFTIPVAILVRTSPRDKGLQSDGEPEDGLSAPAAAAAGSTESGASLGEALHSRPFWLIIAAHLICGITCGLLATHTVIFATDLGYSAIIGASFLSVQGGVGLLGVMVTGVLSDRLARNKVLSMTHLIRSLAMLLLVIAIISGGTLWLLYLAMALFGFGWFTTSPLVGGLVADLFGNLRMGTILGVVLSSHMVGMAIGAYAGGLCYQLTGSYRDVFIMTAALEMTACICAFLIKNPGWRRAPASPD